MQRACIIAGLICRCRWPIVYGSGGVCICAGIEIEGCGGELRAWFGKREVRRKNDVTDLKALGWRWQSFSEKLKKSLYSRGHTCFWELKCYKTDSGIVFGIPENIMEMVDLLLQACFDYCKGE